MKVHQLIAELQTYPDDFDVEFAFVDKLQQDEVRTLVNITINDTCYTDKTLTLTGDEK